MLISSGRRCRLGRLARGIQRLVAQLVARCCLEALNTPDSIGRILEVTSSQQQPVVSLQEALASC